MTKKAKTKKNGNNTTGTKRPGTKPKKKKKKNENLTGGELVDDLSPSAGDDETDDETDGEDDDITDDLMGAQLDPEGDDEILGIRHLKRRESYGQLIFGAGNTE